MTIDDVETAKGLARYLTERWNSAVEVEIEGVASAGARRRNVLFEADDGQEVHRLVATIVPTAALQIQDFMVEPRAIELAEAHGVPVAHMVGATTDESFLGGPFFVTSRVDGESVPRRVLRLVETTGVADRLVAQCGKAMADLHRVPLEDAPEGLAVGSGGLATEEALARLELSMVDLLQPSPVFSLGFRWLERHLPSVIAPPAVVHGDFRTGNLMIGPDGLRAIFDWEGVRIGDPMEDPSWMCVRMWRFGNDDREAGGFADRDDLARAYQVAGGAWDDERFDWWQILGTLRWGIGLAHQARAHLDGSFPSIVMAGSGRRVAEQEYDLLTLLRPRIGRPTV